MKVSFIIFALSVFIFYSAFRFAGHPDSPVPGKWVDLHTEPYPGKQDDICFVNERLGWYVNGYGRIYHMADSGRTWHKQLEKKGSFFRCIAFVDSLHGFAGAVGTDYFPNVPDIIPLYGTNDGGKSWQALILTEDAQAREFGIGFINASNGFVGAINSGFETRDGGLTWCKTDLGRACNKIRVYQGDAGVYAYAIGVQVYRWMKE